MIGLFRPRLINLFKDFVNDQLEAQLFFLYLIIPILYMFRATKCTSSEESVVFIQLILLMMSTWLLETCRELE